MKFGRNLHKHQVPLWAASYLNYDGLKNLIKLSRVETVERGEPLDSLSVLGKINREIDNVQVFYHKVYTKLWDEVSRFYISPDFLQWESWEGVDRHELLYLLGVFIHCRSELKKIQWYGTINAYGFKRLLEKLDHSRFGSATSTKIEDAKSRLSSVQFSSQSDCRRDLHYLQRSIASITSVVSKGPSVSRSLILIHFISSSNSSLSHLDVAYEAIKSDDVSSLDQFIQDNVDVAAMEQDQVRMLILVFIQLSVIYGSARCIGRLFLLIESISKEDFTIKEYLPLVIIKILIRMGHLKLIPGALIREPTLFQPRDEFTRATDGSTTLLSLVLSELGGNVQVALLTRDPSFGCIPLQYAAQYGLFEACGLLLNHMQGTKNDDSISSSESINWQDCLGSSSLRVAISSGDDKMSKLLLGFLRQEQLPGNKTNNLLPGALLLEAIKFSPRILNELVSAGLNVDHQGPQGETALYIAARSGDDESVKTLLSHKANATIAEKVRGWTPLIVASVEGHERIVQLFIHAGASQQYKDLMGWAAIDHAAFRGHITLAKKLRELQDGRPTSGDVPRRGMPISRSVGHVRMPLNECLILATLVSFDSYEHLVADKIGPYLPADESTIESGLGLSIEISLIGRGNSGYTVDLPILEETVNKPWTFYTNDPDNAKLMFKIYRKAVNANNCAEAVHVGSGIALLNSLKQKLGSDLESLVRDYKIPIVAKNGLDDMGVVTFSLLFVKPHLQSASFTSARKALWKIGAVTKVVGHRGLGQNFSEHKHLSIGENTIQSFLTATDLGADAVELDVQLTKDHVPVVYHDFLVSETGTDAWMHSISLKQFKHISDSQSVPVKTSSEEAIARRSRSRSLDTSEDNRIAELTERMKHTYGFKIKGFKANTRGDYIQEPFITLDDLLSKTPDSLTLNIEIKYPMLFEAVDEWKSDNTAIELNVFVDTILSSVLLHPSCRSRSIMFSSFSPEVCILVSLKQTTFPIFFLNDSGNFPTGDVRASNLQQAIHFAKKWALDGIVMASEPFVYAPKLVGLAKGEGLMTASYGVLNNEPDYAKIQAAAGLDIIIVDAVRRISETLQGTG